MFTIEMWVENGSWSIAWEGSRKLKGDLRHRRYKWEPSRVGQWVSVGGMFATPEEADLKCVQFMACGSSRKPKMFRVVIRQPLQ